MEQVGLIGRDIVKMLESEARRKPHIADLLTRARTGLLSDAEIASAPVPLPWFRKALTRARDDAAKNIAMKAMFDDVIPDTLNDGANAEIGTTVVYRGENCWIKPRRGLATEIRTGDSLFFPDSGGVWLNQTFFTGNQPEFRQVHVVVKQTRKEYIDAYLTKLGTA